MDLTPSPRVRSILDRIALFYDAEVQTREERLGHRLRDGRQYLDATGWLHPEIQEARRAIMRASGQAGLYSLHLPERVGGGGLGRAEMLSVEEKVYSYGVGLNPAILAWTDGATPRLAYCGPHQREQFADPLVRGEWTSLHGVTEPQAGSHLFDLQTTAIKDGDTWVLSGHKAFITNAPFADVADVLAVTDPGQGRQSFTYFQFPTAPYLGRGYRVGAVYQTMFDDGLTGEIFLEDLRLPETAILGQRGQGFAIAMTSLNWTRMRRGGMCSGWSKYLIDRTITRAQTRIVGGKPLGSNQGLQWMIADMYLDWQQARALSLVCAAELDAADQWWQPSWPPEAIRRVCLVKLANDEAFYRVADRALQIHGGAGVLKDTALNKLFRIARNLRIPGGTDEVQRTTIAQTLGLQ